MLLYTACLEACYLISCYFQLAESSEPSLPGIRRSPLFEISNMDILLEPAIRDNLGRVSVPLETNTDIENCLYNEDNLMVC